MTRCWSRASSLLLWVGRELLVSSLGAVEQRTRTPPRIWLAEVVQPRFSLHADTGRFETKATRLFHCGEPGGSIVGDERVNEVVEISGQGGLETERLSKAMIDDDVLLVAVGPNPFGSIARSDHA